MGISSSKRPPLRSSSKRPQFTSETGTIHKKWTGKLPIALVYPNEYEVGMSNLGMQHVYALTNSHEGIVCERVFLPKKSQKPLSVESHRPLSDFPVYFCALSFEQDYVNLLRLFRQAGVEPFAAMRHDAFLNGNKVPLIIGGGVATFINPEPLAPFIDIFLLGEAESFLPKFLGYLLKNINQKMTLHVGKTFSRKLSHLCLAVMSLSFTR